MDLVFWAEAATPDLMVAALEILPQPILEAAEVDLVRRTLLLELQVVVEVDMWSTSIHLLRPRIHMLWAPADPEARLARVAGPEVVVDLV